MQYLVNAKGGVNINACEAALVQLPFLKITLILFCYMRYNVVLISVC